MDFIHLDTRSATTALVNRHVVAARSAPLPVIPQPSGHPEPLGQPAVTVECLVVAHHRAAHMRYWLVQPAPPRGADRGAK